MKNSPHSINSLARRNRYLVNIAGCMVAIVLCVTSASMPAVAQLAGQGSLQGTVTDSTGAVIPSATVTVTNTATHVSAVQKSSSAGFYNISPLAPGTYTCLLYTSDAADEEDSV